MAGEMEIKLEIKRPLRKEKKIKENRRVRKMEKQIKDLRKLVTRAGNEIYQRKHWRKLTHKDKKITKELKRKTNSNLNKLKGLDNSEEKIVRQFKGKDSENGKTQGVFKIFSTHKNFLWKKQHLPRRWLKLLQENKWEIKVQR